MARKQTAKAQEETALKPVQRLCSEIQLFDLCDLDVCRFKQGRFCTQEELLSRFEGISEDDASQLRVTQDGEESDEDTEESLLYCDDLDGESYSDDDGNDGWEDE